MKHFRYFVQNIRILITWWTTNECSRWKVVTIIFQNNVKPIMGKLQSQIQCNNTHIKPTAHIKSSAFTLINAWISHFLPKSVTIFSIPLHFLMIWSLNFHLYFISWKFSIIRIHTTQFYMHFPRCSELTYAFLLMYVKHRFTLNTNRKYRNLFTVSAEELIIHTAF